MERYKKAVFYCSVILLILGTAVTFQEGPTLPQEEQFFYYVFRAVIMSILAVLLWPIKKDPFSPKLNLAAATLFSLYNIQGQYYNPWYIFSYMQVTYAIAFLYPLKRWIFFLHTMISTIAFIAVVIWRFDIFVRWAANPVLLDIVFSTLCTMAVALMANYFFTADRSYREDTIRRFGLIGVQSASLIHDIKGLVSAPQVYTELIQKQVEKYDDVELKELTKNLSQSLDRFSLILNELNRVASLHIRELEEFELSEVIAEISDALSISRKNITLHLDSDLVLYTEKAQFKSIALNIVLNSMQSFQRTGRKNPTIRIFVEDGSCIVFADNAGGFSTPLLAKLESEKYSRQEISGTGLGTFLIIDGMKSLGGFARFKNSAEGADVSLHFPKKVFASKARPEVLRFTEG